jgi:plasmid stabilization system protein ParE
MAYRVEFSARAKSDFADIYISKDASESEPAARWYERLVTSIRPLSEQPSRCPVAPEARTARRDLRHLLYGKKPRIYRIIYEIDEYRNIVRILTIRHGARKRLRPTDLA